MTADRDFSSLPQGLPVPVDDGACDHLVGVRLPPVSLPATTGQDVDLASLQGHVVIYCYPMTGRPGVALPEGWDEIPGARGCTPQTCSFRDRYQEIQSLGAEVLGFSTQTTEYQREMAERLFVPFPILSDARFVVIDTLRLPTFEVAGMRLVKRLTLIVNSGVIEKVNYPVFPPNEDPDNVIAWLKEHPES